MIPEKLKKEVQQKSMVPMLIWGALCMSIVIYFVVATLVTQSNKPEPVPSVLHMVLGGLGVLLTMASLGLFQFRSSEKWLKNNLPKDSVDGDEYSTMISSLFGKAFPLFIVNLVLNESIAILGFLLAMFGQQASLLYPFAGGALLLNLIMFPNFSRMMGRAIRMKRM